ncbi:protein kinase [Oscillibacter sp. CAG:155]|uniref:serine/threonine protein kinase n=1 Tax=Oscillibacter sp. CAG:155 TaxID=1262910 RepID=UPI00263F8A63|nr:protein kinase [Oscillibacter sp. CAG:155]
MCGKEGIPIYDWLLHVLQEEYEQIRVMKESSRGSVRLIQHKATGQKFILHDFAGNAEVYRKLLDYTCPYLPTVYEVAQKDGKNLVLEEFIQGDTLGFLLQDTLFSTEETRKIAIQVCRALWVLHSIGAVHRDVKPENIILRGSEAVLIDFDAARFHKPEHESDTQILGTTGFAAPEQYGLSQSDIRTDIYAMGILINVMLTGEHPSKKLAEGKMGRIVDRCTHVNPQRRYKNVLRLMEAL